MTTSAPHYSAEFQLTVDGAAEVMLRGGNALLGRWAWRVKFAGAIVTILCFLGGWTAVDLIGTALGMTEPPLWFNLVAAFLAGSGFVLWQGRLVEKMAEVTVTSRFCRAGQRMTINPEDVRLETPDALWITRWPGVEAVVKGKDHLGLVVSGIVLPLPLADLPRDAVSQIVQWFDASR